MASGSYSDWIVPVLLQTPSGRELLKNNGEEIHKVSDYLFNLNILVDFAKSSEGEKVSPKEAAESPSVNPELKQQIEDLLIEYD